jgi:hypothetical protein
MEINSDFVFMTEDFAGKYYWKSTADAILAEVYEKEDSKMFINMEAIPLLEKLATFDERNGSWEDYVIDVHLLTKLPWVYNTGQQAFRLQELGELGKSGVVYSIPEGTQLSKQD